jgi:hypothetical protein
MSKKKHPGTAPTNHPRSTRWAVDFDYLDQLSPKEQAWLGKFTDAHYKADPKAMKGRGWSKTKRREAYARKNSANRDLYARDGNPTELHDVEPEPGADPPNWTDTPEYLNSEEYKAALAEHRSTLSPYESRNPSDSQEFRQSKRRLRSLVEEEVGE